MKETETTITWKKTSEEVVYIDCSPGDIMIIKKDDPNYVSLYNKLEVGKTYLLHYKNPKWTSYRSIPKIIGVFNPTVRAHITKINDFLDIRSEFRDLKSHPIELVLSDNIKKTRLLITKKQKKTIVLNKEYAIKYTKAFGHDLYEVLSITVTNDQDLHLLEIPAIDFQLQ